MTKDHRQSIGKEAKRQAAEAEAEAKAKNEEAVKKLRLGPWLGQGNDGTFGFFRVTGDCEDMEDACGA